MVVFLNPRNNPGVTQRDGFYQAAMQQEPPAVTRNVKKRKMQTCCLRVQFLLKIVTLTQSLWLKWKL